MKMKKLVGVVVVENSKCHPIWLEVFGVPWHPIPFSDLADLACWKNIALLLLPPAEGGSAYGGSCHRQTRFWRETIFL